MIRVNSSCQIVKNIFNKIIFENKFRNGNGAMSDINVTSICNITLEVLT